MSAGIDSMIPLVPVGQITKPEAKKIQWIHKYSKCKPPIQHHKGA